MKLFILFIALSCVRAQIITPAVTSQQSNILRSFGNLGQVSTYSKSIDTPFSSVSKSDVRVSNPRYGAFVAPAFSHKVLSPTAVTPAFAHGVVAPALAHGVVAPTYAHIVAAPALAQGVVAPTYAHTIAAPDLADGVVAPTYTHTVAAPALAHGVVTPTYAHAVAAPALAHGVVAPAVAPNAIVGHGHIGTAYSAAPAIAHTTFSNGLGISYAW